MQNQPNHYHEQKLQSLIKVHEQNVLRKIELERELRELDGVSHIRLEREIKQLETSLAASQKAILTIQGLDQ